jgi:hypothetical protein
MERKTLYQRLNKDIRDNLLANQENYTFTVTSTIKILDAKLFWSELKISEINNLIIYGGVDFGSINGSTLMTGENIIEDE